MKLSMFFHGRQTVRDYISEDRRLFILTDTSLAESNVYNHGRELYFSVHGLTVDYSHRRQQLPSWYFNSRPHREVDKGRGDADDALRGFQSTTSQGGRRQILMLFTFFFIIHLQNQDN